MVETWKSVPGYEGIYEISDLGRIKSYAVRIFYKRTNEGRILSQYKSNSGYLIARLCKDGTHKKFLVHKLVLLVFKGPSKLHCNHRDGNKLNNHLENLEYCTTSENMIHSYNNGFHPKGENHGRARLTDIQVKEIRIRINNGDIQKKIAEDYSVSAVTISKIKKNKTRKETR